MSCMYVVCTDLPCSGRVLAIGWKLDTKGAMAGKERIAIATDHAGVNLKRVLKHHLENWGYDVLDLGTDSAASVDYPDYGSAVAGALGERRADRGVIICGTGVGIAIAANRYPHVRAVVCHDITTARLGRLHNDANVLSLGARVIGEEVARDCLKVFLDTHFEGGRHGRRVAKLSEICGNNTDAAL